MVGTKSMNNNNNNQDEQYKIIPYSVTREVLKQDDLADISGYDRHKGTRKYFTNKMTIVKGECPSP